jgi:AcrR family transcriptional regulator
VRRLTRAESQAATRTALLATAKTLFLRDGYLATSIDKVAEEAGYSKGAVYSNFRNKDELCIAVLDEIRSERTGEILTILRAATNEERLSLLEKWAETVIGDPAWTRLEMEFAIQASRDDRLRREVGGRLEALTQLIGDGLQVAVDGDAIEPQLPVGDVAVALLAMGVGLGLFRAMAPSIPVHPLVDTLRLMAGIATPPPKP